MVSTILESPKLSYSTEKIVHMKFCIKNTGYIFLSLKMHFNRTEAQIG